ncbi:MAG: hypothetical protein Q9169_006133 [Polycauliona sp. 2 TL-2023]
MLSCKPAAGFHFKELIPSDNEARQHPVHGTQYSLFRDVRLEDSRSFWAESLRAGHAKKVKAMESSNLRDLTDLELSKTMEAQSYFPGDFQIACSEIFGGFFQGKDAKNPDWAPDAESYAAMTPELAHRTFKIGLATQVSDEITKRYKDQNRAGDLETLKVYNACLEVTELLPTG